MKLKDEIPLLLSQCTDQDLVGVFRWFNSQRSVFYWGGPDLTYPLQIKRFKVESKFQNNLSYVLKQGRQLLAFGQIHNRLDHCHMGRLVVSPRFRGQNIGAQLIRELMAEGERQLGLKRSSLFVLKDNQSAMQLYKKMNFVLAQYPKAIPLKNCLYMIRSEKPE